MSFALIASLLLLSSSIPASAAAVTPALDIAPETDNLAPAAAEYRSIWETDGPRIVAALERITGLRFESGPIRVVVYEGPSSSGYRERPMQLRASYPRATKQATLVHELAHRLISELVTGSFEDHPIIFLFVYDVWVELWGKEFADREVEVESARKGLYDYAGAWRDALALTPEERAKRFRQFLAEVGQVTGMTDPRDGRVYDTVVIGSQTWFAENLDFDAGTESRCLEDDPGNCEKFGRLYRWPAAMRACPPGWRLPSEIDWQTLERHLGMAEADLEGRKYRGVNEGASLRADGESGFRALLAGYMRPDGTARRVQERAAFWTATELEAGATSWHRDVSGDPRIYRSPVDHEYYLSVRCIAGDAPR
jgi:uncharacterized protein (TIGR02145 family)